MKHGYKRRDKRHPLYHVWQNLKKRCLDEGAWNFANYGGRGIAVCEEWVGDPKAFIEWALENGWKKGLNIDRIDNDGDYRPENCRFITPQKSACNKRLLTKANQTGYRGISFNPVVKKWVARICIKGKQIHLGCFESPVMAAIRYDTEAYPLDDERPMNFIDRV